MKKISILLLIYLYIGCVSVSTKINSITDPDYKGTKLSHLLIFANVNDLGMKQSIEQKFIKTFTSKYDVKASAGHEILPPTRQYTETELKTIL
ncbi:MAG TPA: hypothetical protein PLH00_06250, partial [Bacteroidaceae bacterium]|nr:hypothetical protein [Bacteroidaceae bacterium]